MASHLIIGDAHAKPGVSNERFAWLGRLATERQPSTIIDMGDWADMPSLSSYDKGRKDFEGRRYKHDIAAARDARARFDGELVTRKGYKPRKVALGGNHCEGRINRAIQLSPELDGVISHEDLGYAEFGWDYVPFLQPICLDGVYYCHYFTSGVMGRAIGGEHPATSLVTKQLVSCTSGHVHLRDFSERTNAAGKKILGLFPGCYFSHEEKYAAQANKLWWRGVVMAHEVRQGVYDPEFISLETIKRVYG